jgi:molybdopterin-guanine dinucleotide biosynthesis protein A
MEINKPAGVILAGGRSSRMGGGCKALIELAGCSLLERVVERLRPQTGGLLLSCEADTGDFDRFDLPRVPDLLSGHCGPLVGLYSALLHLVDTGQCDSLVLCPCDAPFVPLDLVPVLLEAGRGGQAAVVSWRGVLQPTFSLWHDHHLALLREALLEKGLGGPRQVLRQIPHEVVEWPDVEPPPFFNVNTPADLERAAEWLDHAGV